MFFGFVRDTTIPTPLGEYKLVQIMEPWVSNFAAKMPTEQMQEIMHILAGFLLISLVCVVFLIRCLVKKVCYCSKKGEVPE